MLTKETRVDRIEILPDGSLQIRQAVVIVEDGVDLCIAGYARLVHKPGDDVKDAPERVQKVAEAVWTPDVVAAEEAKAADLQAESIKGA